MFDKMFLSSLSQQIATQISAKISTQTGQILPGALVSLGLTGGLGVSITPAMSDFIDKAEHTSITYAHSALSSSLQINHLLTSSNTLIIAGENVALKNGYPVAKSAELEKVASFGSQKLVNNANKTVTIWSIYHSYCFVYNESDFKNGIIIPAKLSNVSASTDSTCTTL